MYVDKMRSSVSANGSDLFESDFIILLVRFSWTNLNWPAAIFKHLWTSFASVSEGLLIEY